MIVSTDEGAVYTLRFGEVVFATGEELSAGTEEDAAKDEGQGEGRPRRRPTGRSESRYVMVTVAFDPDLLPPEPDPDAEGLAHHPRRPLPAAPRTTPSGSPRRRRPRRRRTARRPTQEKRIADARKRVQELTDRFADWYYVTPGESFRSIVLDRAALTRPKGSEPAAGAAASAPTCPESPASRACRPIERPGSWAVPAR